MSNILWSGFNILVFLGLLYTFFRAGVLVKQHLGTSVALVFIAGLLLVGCRPTSVPIAANVNLLASTPKTPVGNASSHHSTSLGVGTQLQLLTEYQLQQTVVRPLGLYVFVSGLQIGHAWKPLVGRVEQAGRQLRYHVAMQHDWKLLHWTIFSETTDFEGTMPITVH